MAQAREVDEKKVNFNPKEQYINLSNSFQALLKELQAEDKNKVQKMIINIGGQLTVIHEKNLTTMSETEELERKIRLVITVCISRLKTLADENARPQDIVNAKEDLSKQFIVFIDYFEKLLRANDPNDKLLSIFTKFLHDDLHFLHMFIDAYFSKNKNEILLKDLTLIKKIILMHTPRLFQIHPAYPLTPFQKLLCPNRKLCSYDREILGLIGQQVKYRIAPNQFIRNLENQFISFFRGDDGWPTKTTSADRWPKRPNSPYDYSNCLMILKPEFAIGGYKTYDEYVSQVGQVRYPFLKTYDSKKRDYLSQVGDKKTAPLSKRRDDSYVHCDYRRQNIDKKTSLVPKRKDDRYFLCILGNWSDRHQIEMDLKNKSTIGEKYLTLPLKTKQALVNFRNGNIEYLRYFNFLKEFTDQSVFGIEAHGSEFAGILSSKKEDFEITPEVLAEIVWSSIILQCPHLTILTLESYACYATTSQFAQTFCNTLIELMKLCPDHPLQTVNIYGAKGEALTGWGNDGTAVKHHSPSGNLEIIYSLNRSQARLIKETDAKSTAVGTGTVDTISETPAAATGTGACLEPNVPNSARLFVTPDHSPGPGPGPGPAAPAFANHQNLRGS